MKRARREVGGGSRRSGLGLLAALLVAAAAASTACRGPQGSAGIGGQSGDEGRRPGAARWLGTGGVSAEPFQP